MDESGSRKHLHIITMSMWETDISGQFQIDISDSMGSVCLCIPTMGF